MKQTFKYSAFFFPTDSKYIKCIWICVISLLISQENKQFENKDTNQATNFLIFALTSG